MARWLIGRLRLAARGRCRGLIYAMSLTLVLVASCGAGAGRGKTGLIVPPLTSSTKVVCTRYAEPLGAGSSRGLGTRRDPLRGFQRLVNSLRPGQTGCLLSGRYVEDPDVRSGGTSTQPLVIRGAPGATAELDGNLSIEAGAPHVTVEYLTICGAPGASSCRGTSFSSGRNTAVDISAGHVALRYDDISDPLGVCVLIGTASSRSDDMGPADFAWIAHNRIHNCGGEPGTSTTLEGVYSAYTVDSAIVYNQIYNNASMAIQFYPDAQDNVFEHNHVWHNGAGVSFGGVGSFRSNGNTVAYNVIQNSVGWNVSSYWPDGVGVGNVVAHNCLRADRTAPYYRPNDGIQPRRLGGLGFTSYDDDCTD